MATIEAYYRHEHGDKPVRIQTDEDLDALVDALLAEPYENSVAALYVEGRLNAAGVPDHELLVAVNHEDRVGGLRFMGDGGTYFSAGEPSRHDEVIYYYMGNDREFPRASEITIDTLRKAVKTFLANGGHRPTGVEWTGASSGELEQGPA
ncbi:Imm1 family immunity protein [Kribbella sp. NPDC058245]|uniref:Imm1 family immunity protein n=1 Tax=Kribbella sp. NPDC058245 TaxID=3346399 RepID=UPI0036F167C4